MSIKVREGRLEVKRRYGNVETIELCPEARGQLESWRKWSIDLGNVERLPASVPTDTWIPVTKRRRLCAFRKLSGRWRPVSFDLVSFDGGCEMEMTTLRVGSQGWWTLAFEAFGPAKGNRAALLSLSTQIFSSLDPPDLSTPDSYGYPRWLDQLT
jgi:hypothetical protein